ncbi:MAG: hypothetical protein IPO69_04195 [Saprospiraceae bacterium]|nr:hypothetical protein [Saprospiraceae bacterium]
MRGYKRDLYEGGIRVPRPSPGNGLGQKLIHEPLANWDILPTIAELLHAEKPNNINGVSFLNVLSKSQSKPVHPYLYWEFHERGFDPALRKANGKPSNAASTGQPVNCMILIVIRPKTKTLHPFTLRW